MSKELEDKARKLRAAVKAQLQEISGGKGSMLSPEVLSHFLKVSYRTIYRWIKEDLYFPSLEQCNTVLDFLQEITEKREAWRSLASKWRGFGFQDLDNDIRRTLFNQKMLTVLEDSDLSIAEKTEELTVLVLRAKAKVEEED
jgi:hypothetical protein